MKLHNVANSPSTTLQSQGSQGGQGKMTALESIPEPPKAFGPAGTLKSD